MIILSASVVRAVSDAWVSDDIYITFRYADNVLDGLGPVYNAGERSEGYTHFLWFVLLTLGRAAAIPAHLLGKYLAFPAFLGILFLLTRISRQLFPGRGGWSGIPVAALAWAVHEEAELFASGGLETTPFLFFLLVGFHFLATSRHRRRDDLAAWAYGIAALLRPEGMLFAFLAVLWLFWNSGWNLRRALRFGLLFLALVVPLYLFRLSYYGWLFPSPYYAKSGGSANWPQGGVYFATYFLCYWILLAGFAAIVPILRNLSRHATGWTAAASRPLLLAWVSATVSVFYATRVGGDFMFARFYLPGSLFLVLLLEFLLQHMRAPRSRAIALVIVLLAIVYGGFRKDVYFGDKNHVWGIVDEPQFYPDDRLDFVRASGKAIADCMADTDIVIMVQGGQAALAYYGRFPTAIERYGLTDPVIAHGPTLKTRQRPGHEKIAPPDYLYARGLNLRIHGQLIRSKPQYVLFGLPVRDKMVYGEIITYRRELMEQLKHCHGIIFLDFPVWLANTYIPNIGEELPHEVMEDYLAFKRYYFNINEDPEGLLPRLEQAMRDHDIPIPRERPLPPDFFEDTGHSYLPSQEHWSFLDLLRGHSDQRVPR
jgi:hypothetical protein